MKEVISVFDMFKIGIGPSSSHTLGPWRAALLFLEELKQQNLFKKVQEVHIKLYGSLAKTGKGHGTDVAVQLGLMGEDPVIFAVEAIEATLSRIIATKQLSLAREHTIIFHPAAHIHFLKNETLPFHPNALRFVALMEHGKSHEATYYSVGGGFVVQEGENLIVQKTIAPYVHDHCSDLLHNCTMHNRSISQLVFENEQHWHNEAFIHQGLKQIWNVMRACIYKGCHTEGVLPGGLAVRRRAGLMNKKLLNKDADLPFEDWVQSIRMGGDSFAYILDWVVCFALAVNEENASFGRVVTAPTNGAAGVIPAVLMYYTIFTPGVTDERIEAFLLTASEIGALFKKGATISAAMGGCQAEIGVSSAMAAAALTEGLGGSPAQATMAAEIAMEHHLGLTCDPVGGLVQIPCIERNTMGAIKAITAAQLALQGTPDTAKVSLDAVIETMWETALDMNSKYKETAEGGLAVNLPISLSEC